MNGGKSRKACRMEVPSEKLVSLYPLSKLYDISLTYFTSGHAQ